MQNLHRVLLHPVSGRVTLRLTVATGIALVIVGSGSVLLALSAVVHSHLALRLGLGVFEASFTVPLTVGGLLFLSVGILLLAIPKPAQGSGVNPPGGG